MRTTLIPAADIKYVKMDQVVANAGSLDDVRAAVSAGAEGVGLLRTEFLFVGRSTLPDEDEQFAAYRQLAETLQGRPMIVRTLDVGADKPLSYLPRPSPHWGTSRYANFNTDPVIARPKLYGQRIGGHNTPNTERFIQSGQEGGGLVLDCAAGGLRSLGFAPALCVHLQKSQPELDVVRL